jgi:Na+/H+ antiporter NhaD/arsenite permease-like protein
MMLQLFPSLINWLITTTFINYCRTSSSDSIFHIRYNDDTHNNYSSHSKINQNEEEIDKEVTVPMKQRQKSVKATDIIPWFFLLFIIVLELSNIISLTVLFSLSSIFCIVVVILLEYYNYEADIKLSDKLLMIEDYIENIFLSIDYNLLMIFCGLFVCSGTLVETQLPEKLFYLISDKPFTTIRSTILSGIYICVMSQFVGNVPLVIMMTGPILKISDISIQRYSWLLLSYISTVAGNLTLSGSAANIIVAEICNKHKLKIQVGAVFHFKLCFLITTVNIILGSLLLGLE